MLKPYVCQRKTVPTSRGPSIVDESMSGSHSDQEEMSVCRPQTVPSGASMRVSSRVMTGAFWSMSIVGILFSLASGFYRLRHLVGCIRQPAGLNADFRESDFHALCE